MESTENVVRLTTAQAIVEFLKAQWTEFDMETATWAVPASRMKRGARSMPRNARTGELTPLGSTRSARSKSASFWLRSIPRRVRHEHDR